ncbi:DMT family transporter [Metabacillus sp. FJAT-52054]|uniref:DMT family transporter n=1 Tax=Metabacillus sediminis TaxID=3117746 RepID=A0ABZ2NHJ8_9BACI
MIGMILAAMAGLLISLQTVFNARVSSKAGAWLTTMGVLGLGLVSSLVPFFLIDGGNLFDIGDLNPFYLLSGLFGVGIVFSVMKGIQELGPAFSVSIVIVVQLTLALIIDSFGLFEATVIPFSLNKLAGILIMMAGIVVYKWQVRGRVS